MRSWLLAPTLALTLAVGISACGSTVPYHRTGAPAVHTQSVLHPDERRAVLYSVNYQLEGSYLPACTEVQILEVNREHAVFRIAESGRTYTYRFHKTMQESIQQHLDRVFGPPCDPADFAALSDVDQQGIYEGRALIGMTREGVLRAMGYPPSHATPYIERDVWKYWVSKMLTMEVVFSHDLVSEVRGLTVRSPEPVPWDLADGQVSYTLVNLHPDAHQRVLYSTNYQRDGLIPLCSAVRITGIDTDKMVFTVQDTGRRYEYFFHRRMTEGIREHLGRYFGRTCNADAIYTMSEADQRGIELGRVLVGMTKPAVLAAIGYPPKHSTPRLEEPIWTYWINRFKRMKVRFEGDVVTQVVH